MLASWIQTYTGKMFFPLDPKPEHVDLLDIGHSLAMQCRFGGSCQRFYSVAEHSLNVAAAAFDDYDDLNLYIHALLHDAGEAYLHDIPSPIKQHMLVGGCSFKDREKSILDAIYQSLGLPQPTEKEKRIIHQCDLEMLATEAKQLLTPPPAPWVEMPEPRDMVLKGYPPFVARYHFMEALAMLFPGRVDLHTFKLPLGTYYKDLDGGIEDEG